MAIWPLFSSTQFPTAQTGFADDELDSLPAGVCTTSNSYVSGNTHWTLYYGELSRLVTCM